MKGYSVVVVDWIGYDLQVVKDLFVEVGYLDGFFFGLMCLNDCYINDEVLCKVMVVMLIQVGMWVEFNVMLVCNYWLELCVDNFDMYFFGWLFGIFDVEYLIWFLVIILNMEKKFGSWNFGGYFNVCVDELLLLIQKEIDLVKCQVMLDEVVLKVCDDVVYVLLYIQLFLWGLKVNVDFIQWVDNFFMLCWIIVN